MHRFIPLVLIACAHVAAAKCIYMPVTVSGVTRSTSGAALAGGLLTASYVEYGEITHQSAMSGPDGRYRLRFAFNAWSGGGAFGGDQCHAKLQSLELIASKPGFGDQSKSVPLQNAAATATFTLAKLPTSPGSG